MTQQFTEDVEIQGNLEVEGNLQVGDDPGTTNAMVEAHRHGTSTSKPKRGLQVDGEIENEDNPSGTVTWSNHEVSVSGASTDVTQVTALRASAQSSDGTVDTLVGIEANVDPVSGTVAEAVGLNIPDVTGATDNYAIKTGSGKISLGEFSGFGEGIIKVNDVGELSFLDLSDFLPVGIVLPYAGPTAPSGWLICNGQSLAISSYTVLFNVIGGTYGFSGHAQQFNVPDLRGRAVIGAGQGTGLTNRSLGDDMGSENHTLTIGEMPQHRHKRNGNATAEYVATGTGSQWYGSGGVGYATHSDTGYAGGGGAHNNMQPSLVLNYIIKAQ